MTIYCICALMATCQLNAQARLVINGCVINIKHGAALVIDNPANTAITYLGSGYIQSEETGNNKVIWKIGSGNNNAYLVPFGTTAGYLPMKFTAASGQGDSGRFVLSTYATPNWKNSDYLPAGVTNTNRNDTDNSVKLVDRFWQISPEHYTKKPMLSNISFTYADAELAIPNTIEEKNLAAIRWNPALQSWNDYVPVSAANNADNTVTVVKIESEQLYNWWTLADLPVAIPSSLFNFRAQVYNGQVITSWQTIMEQGSDHFEVWRSKDGITFELAGSIAAAINTPGISSYSFTDTNPYTGISYYKCKSVAQNGNFKWSAIVPVTIDITKTVFLYPNPARNFITINSSTEIINSKAVGSLYDAGGKLVHEFLLTTTNQQLNISGFESGIYQVIIRYNNQTITTRFIKN